MHSANNNVNRKHYNDDHLRAELSRRVEGTTYRAVADLIGVDYAYLHRMVAGKMPVSKKVGEYLGFELAEERWTRRAVGRVTTRAARSVRSLPTESRR